MKIVVLPAYAYIEVSYKCGIGSTVPGGAKTISLLIDSDLAAMRASACSIGAPKAFWKSAGEI